MRARRVIVASVAALSLLTPTAARAESGSDIIERAQSWTTAGVPYQAGGTFTNQYGTYRTDCSGFVSMALGLPTSYTTATMLSVSYPIAKDGLEPGDLLLNPAEGASGHVTLFGGWADDARTRYYAYEQSPSGGAHLSEIPYPYWPGYGTFTPRRYSRTVSTSAPPIDIPEPVPPVRHAASPPGDGDFVRHAGQVYRVAGDSAVAVTSWQNVGGRKDVRTLSDTDFAELAEHPADGTVLRTPRAPLGRDETYVVAGGAPVFLPEGSPQKAVLVDQVAVDRAGQGGPFDRLNDQPADGTVVRTASDEHYVFAGGAPIHITDTWWRAQRPRPSATRVSQAALDGAGGLNAWSHVRYFPFDNTLVKAGSAVYRIDGGIPVEHHGVRGVSIDPQALANAGGSGPWAHLVASRPPVAP